MSYLSIVRIWWQSAIDSILPADGTGTISGGNARGEDVRGTTPTVRNCRLSTSVPRMAWHGLVIQLP